MDNTPQKTISSGQGIKKYGRHEYEIEREQRTAQDLYEATKGLNSMLKGIRSQLNSKASEKTILAIIQDNPCPLKAQYLVRNYANGNNIDSIYTAIHELAQKEVIDHILDEFGDLVKIKAEEYVPYGRLDIRIEFDNARVTLKNNLKVVAIEIKTGEIVKTEHFKQIDRYFLSADIDALIRIRVITGEVTLVNNTFKDLLIGDIVRLNNKSKRITIEAPNLIPGNWCRGCEATCPHRNPLSNHRHYGSLESYEDLKRNIRNVAEKTVTKLKELIQNMYGSSIDQGGSKISSEENKKEEEHGKKVSINQLLRPCMYDLSIEGKIESISEPREIMLRTGDTKQVVDAVISDQTGRISVSLWDNYNESLKEGDYVTIERAYTKEYNGKISLSVWKSGKVVRCPDRHSEVLTTQKMLNNVGAI
jgi:OB-fold nucleic acid binding domain